MEGGSPILEWITYGMIACVLFAIGFLVYRSLRFFLSLLLIPVTDALGRTRLFGGAVRRWGEAGAPRSGLPTLSAEEERAVAEAARAAAPQVPLAVQRAIMLGAALGACPGLWWAVRGVQAGLARGDSTGGLAATAGIAIGLVSAAGAIVGGVVGAAVGLVVEAGRRR